MNMKKILAGIFAGLTVTACAACTTAEATTLSDAGYYPAVFIVTNVDELTPDCYIVTGEDCNGNEWSWTSEDGDVLEGELYAAIMYDRETDIIYDDEIVDVRYAGIPEWYSDPSTRPTGERPESEEPAELQDFAVVESDTEDIAVSTDAEVVGLCEVVIPDLGEYLA